jgi:hypothetical protein
MEPQRFPYVPHRHPRKAEHHLEEEKGEERIGYSTFQYLEVVMAGATAVVVTAVMMELEVVRVEEKDRSLFAHMAGAVVLVGRR